MEEKTKYYLLKQKAVPEVLLKVAEAKKLIASEKAMTIQEATDQLGISRSSFYKYKDDIFPFYDNAKGKTITMVLQMDDEQGLLSDLLHIVAIYKANILTIHQSIPVNNVATLTLSVEVRSDTGNISHMVEEMEENSGVHNVKIIARSPRPPVHTGCEASRPLSRRRSPPRRAQTRSRQRLSFCLPPYRP